MNLLEEYHNRHGLECPLIHRPTSKESYFLFSSDRSVWSPRWIILHIGIEVPPHEPPYYRFTWMEPNHNSPNPNSFLRPIMPSQSVNWERFEEESIAIVQNYQFLTPLHRENDIAQAIWEMFLIAADQNLSGLSSFGRQLLYQSIDLDLPEHERLQAIDECVKLIEKNNLLGLRWSAVKKVIGEKYYAKWMLALFSQKDKINNYRQLLDVA